MQGIQLPILFKNKQTEYKSEQGEKYPLSENDLKDMTFYKIHAIMPCIDDVDEGAEYSEIVVGKNRFICPLPYDELKEKLAEWKT